MSDQPANAYPIKLHVAWAICPTTGQRDDTPLDVNARVKEIQQSPDGDTVIVYEFETPVPCPICGELRYGYADVPSQRMDDAEVSEWVDAIELWMSTLPKPEDGDELP